MCAQVCACVLVLPENTEGTALPGRIGFDDMYLFT